MAKSRKKKVDRYQKQKVAAIPILLLVLGYVLWSNLQEDKPTVPKPQVQQASAQPTTTSKTTKNKVPEWPQSGIEFLSGPNPFASYRKFEKEPEPVVESSQTEVVEEVKEPLIEQVGRQLANLPMRYMFKSNGRWVMMLGDRLLTEGDDVAEAIQVEKIEQGRLILKQRSTAYPSSQIQ